MGAWENTTSYDSATPVINETFTFAVMSLFTHCQLLCVSQSQMLTAICSMQCGAVNLLHFKRESL